MPTDQDVSLEIVEAGPAGLSLEYRSGGCGPACRCAAWLSRTPRRLRWPSTPGVSPGTRCQLRASPGAVARAALVIYGIPLAGFVGGALGGAVLGAGADVASLAGGLLGLATALAGLAMASRRRRSPAEHGFELALGGDTHAG